MRDIRLSLVSLSLALVAGCGSQKNIGTTYQLGYVATDKCGSLTTQKDCEANSTCAWLEPTCPDGVKCPPGVCYAPDPCFGIGDEATCVKDSRCAWADVGKLCPVAADCANGGFCHPVDPSGCSCVTPLACPAGKDCPPPECDCSGGGSGGGTCTCACAPCAPGETCEPCKCDCGPGGGGSGCVNDGTCTCACPSCPPGETCPPCACDCGSGGVVSAPTMPTTTSPSGSTDPCSKFTDSGTCTADVNDKCQWYAFGAPCQAGQPCVSGVCQGPTSMSGGGSTGSGGCGCACPPCDPNTMNCAPCTCDCGGSTGCVPPPTDPAPSPSPLPTPCPALGCNPQCPNGVTKDANGCPTCTCA